MIGLISESLRNLLEAEMAPTKVTLLSPADTSSQQKRINLFLYRITPNPFLNNRDWLPKPGAPSSLEQRATTGLPILGVDVRVLGPDDAEVPWDGTTVGEICARSNHIMIGYLDAPAATNYPIAIVHTYQGDLKVDLVAPDGTLYNIHNRSGGGTDNINKTVTLNLSSELLNGTWNLRVNDNGPGDVGKIDSWSITF